MNKPDFDKWAKELINDSWTGDRIDVVSKALRESWERGYKYAVVNDWWQAQEKEHRVNELLETLEIREKLDHI